MSERSFQILFVGDDPDDRNLAEIQLHKINLDVTIDSVGSREAFQEYLKREPLPDLVICEYQLPDYNGEKALEFVRDLHDYLPFILLTGSQDEVHTVELLSKGASDILAKQTLDRLGPAAQRELIKFRERSESQRDMEIEHVRFRTLIENGSDVLFILDPDGQATYISPSIKNVLGYTAEEAMQIDMMENAHPDDTEMIIDEIKKCLEQPGVPMKVPPARLKDKDGNYRWFEGTITNMLHDPAIEGIVDNFYEITERVEAEQKTAEAKNQYQTLIQTIDGIVWQADAETLTFNYVSPQAKKILGYSPEEWIGKKVFWQNRIHPEDRERVLLFCSRQTEKGVNHTFEYRMRKADGDYIWLRDVVTVVKEKGEVITLRGLMIDIDQEKALEHKLEMAYQLAKIGSWEFDIVNEKLYWSTYIKELHEVDDDYEPDLETAINFYTEGWSRDTISKTVEHSITTGEPFDVELPIVTAKGNERWVRAVGRPEFVDDICVRIYGSTQDITDRMEAEQRRVKILESISDAFYAIDSDWNFTYINREAENLIERKAEDLLNKNIWKEFPEARQSELYDIYKEVAESGKSRHFEYYYPPLEIWFDISVNSNEGGLSVFFRNINDRKRSEEKIKRINERFEKVTEATNDAIWDFDVVEGQLFWGKGFETLFGYDLIKTDPSLSFLLSLIHPEDREKVSEKIQRNMAPGGESDWFEEYRFKRADGTYSYVMDRAIFIRNEAGNVTRVVGAMTDLTRQKEYEESLKSLNRELEASNAELEQFAYVVSHDLQEPLRMITGFLGQLEKKFDHLLDETGKKYIHFATDGAKRMRHIILDLLEFSRVGRVDSEREEIDMNDLVQEALALNKKLITEQKADINVEKMPVIHAAEVPMRQLFQNLINNAVKYHQKGRKPNVTINAGEDEHFWHFSIEDNGIGIDQENSAKIFNIFQRLHGSGEYSGSGIGLAICKKIVENHGGKINVVSEPGKGSTFSFSIAKKQMAREYDV